jgi:hypothetical protein
MIRTFLVAATSGFLSLSLGSAHGASSQPRLGDPLSAWQAAYPAEEKGYMTLYDSRFEVMSLGGKLADIVGIRFPSTSLSEAREIVVPLLPEGAELKETYTPEGRPGTKVDLYHSDQLAQAAPDAVYSGGEPGDFVAVFTTLSDSTMITLGLGNNP